MAFRSARPWCYICRDIKPDVVCTGKRCKKGFHLDCLRNTGQLRDDDNVRSNYLCTRCREDEENDSFCYVCKSEGAEDSTLLMCDGCPKSVHLECLGLDDVPTTETWMCPCCSPESTHRPEPVRSTLINVSGGKPKLGNVDICYVCQKGGKLLCCDLCDQSYHPKCIDSEFLDPMIFDESGKWGCPICYGKDPLKNMSHKRLTKQERQRKSALWQKCIARESRRCRANRDRFLYSCYHALEPFVEEDVLTKLKKDAAAASRFLSSCKHVPPKSRDSTGRVTDEKDASQETASSVSSTGSKRPKNRTVQVSEESEKSLLSSDSGFGRTVLPVVVSPTEAMLSSNLSVNGVPRKDTESIQKELSVLYRDEALWKNAVLQAAAVKHEILRDGVRLKPYQRWGVNWLLDAFTNKAGAILADEMGLGKTIQTLAFLSALKALEISGPHLIVVPLSTVGNWIREVRAFTPSLSVTKICGSRQEREHSMMDGVASVGIYDLFVTTYEAVVTEEWFFTDQFKWQCVVLDEAHRIKNESARIRHSLDRVQCNMRVLLTGTPLQNNIKELFTLLNFLFPEIIKNSKTLDTIFHPTKKKVPPAVASSDPACCRPMTDEDETLLMGSAVFDQDKVNAVTTLLSKLMLRRTKDLVVRLPEKIVYDIWLPLSPVAGAWYRRLLEITATANDDATSIRKLLGAVVKIRICCCHPRGLVSRDPQLQNLIQGFRDAGCPTEYTDSMERDAKELKETTSGWAHVRCSSKLLFLDKLLRQLHLENMANCAEYRADFLAVRANQIRQEVNTRRSNLASLLSGRSSAATDTSALESTILRLEKEINILNTPEENGGGLSGLETFLHGPTPPPAEQPDFMTQYMYPWLSSSDVYPASESNTTVSGGEPPKRVTPPEQAPKPHKVLVFTQFQLVLDELSAYCAWRGWRFMRLDGSTNKMIRELDTREFNSQDSTHLVYLISTRAGGLGINLVTANHVVMYDEDWNPFVDLQAVDRAHRIGQTRHVHVWRLMTEWTIEERMALRRQQKLRLDKMLIQANVETLEYDQDPSDHDKLSSDEVRRLLQYGRTALMEVKFANEVEALSLEAAMRRKRRDLKELEAEKLRLLEDPLVTAPDSLHLVEAPRDSPSDGDVRTYVARAPSGGVDDDETDEAVSHSGGTVSTPLLDEDDLDDDQPLTQLESLDAAELYKRHRPQRHRRQPVALYNPGLRLDKIKTERKLVRERRCFRCGGGGPPVGSSAAVSLKTTSSGKIVDPLVGCIRCPKVYHQEACLGFTKAPPKSWICPWHECCLCFRRAGSCGGLLIHCVECPTAFCFDCFPPEYRRYEPPPRFFENLQKRGWAVTPKKLVTFLCSKCKALKEQERRRHLSKQQLEAEMKTRKSKDDSVRQDARKQQQQQQARTERILLKEQRQKEADERKLFFEQKRKIDDHDKQLQDELRTAVEQLYPCKYIDLIRLRRQRLIELHHRTTGATKSTASASLTSSHEQDGAIVKSQQSDSLQRTGEDQEEKVETASGVGHPETEVASMKTEDDDETTSDHKSQRPPLAELQQSPETQGPGGGRKRLVIPDRFKSPSDTLKLCENCHLPLHDVSQCPFPLELTRLRFNVLGKQPSHVPEDKNASSNLMPTTGDMNVHTPTATHEGDDADGVSQTIQTPTIVIEVPDPEDPEPCMKTAAHFSSTSSRPAKIKFRTVCSLCKNPTKLHSRKHCDQLDETAKQQYIERNKKYAHLISLIKYEVNKEPSVIPTPSRLAAAWDVKDFDPYSLTDKLLDAVRRQLNSNVDSVLRRLIREANLSDCIAAEPTAPTTVSALSNDVVTASKCPSARSQSKVPHTSRKNSTKQKVSPGKREPRPGRKAVQPIAKHSIRAFLAKAESRNNKKQANNDARRGKIAEGHEEIMDETKRELAAPTSATRHVRSRSDTSGRKKRKLDVDPLHHHGLHMQSKERLIFPSMSSSVSSATNTLHEKTVCQSGSPVLESKSEIQAACAASTTSNSSVDLQSPPAAAQPATSQPATAQSAPVQPSTVPALQPLPGHSTHPYDPNNETSSNSGGTSQLRGTYRWFEGSRPLRPVSQQPMLSFHHPLVPPLNSAAAAAAAAAAAYQSAAAASGDMMMAAAAAALLINSQNAQHQDLSNALGLHPSSLNVMHGNPPSQLCAPLPPHNQPSQVSAPAPQATNCITPWTPLPPPSSSCATVQPSTHMRIEASAPPEPAAAQQQKHAPPSSPALPSVSSLASARPVPYPGLTTAIPAAAAVVMQRQRRQEAYYEIANDNVLEIELDSETS